VPCTKACLTGSVFKSRSKLASYAQHWLHKTDSWLTIFPVVVHSQLAVCAHCCRRHQWLAGGYTCITAEGKHGRGHTSWILLAARKG
jgi:hypothetical protein